MMLTESPRELKVPLLSGMALRGQRRPLLAINQTFLCTWFSALHSFVSSNDVEMSEAAAFLVYL